MSDKKKKPVFDSCSFRNLNGVNALLNLDLGFTILGSELAGDNEYFLSPGLFNCTPQA
jgi:hypothetical protein